MLALAPWALNRPEVCLSARTTRHKEKRIMKLSILTACVLLAGATAMAAPATQAAATSHSQKASSTQKPKMMWASGTVEKFDATAKLLTVKQDGKEVTFTVDDQAHVSRGKE